MSGVYIKNATQQTQKKRKSLDLKSQGVAKDQRKVNWVNLQQTIMLTKNKYYKNPPAPHTKLKSKLGSPAFVLTRLSLNLQTAGTTGSSSR